MASLAFAVIGGAIGGAAAGGATAAVAFGLTGAQLGFFIGGVVGSVVDAYLFAPDLPDVTGPRLDELRFRSAEEGSPINFMLGERIRVPATLIWAGPLEEYVKKESQGKGGGGGSVTNYSYFNDFAYLIGEGEIEKVVKIWANDKLIYQDLDDIEVTASTQLSVRLEETYVWNDVTMTFDLDKRYQVIESPVGGPDLTDFFTGTDITVTGFANAVNNTTAVVKKIDAITGTGTELWIENLNATTEAAGSAVTLVQTPPTTAGKYTDITIYTGTLSQGRDALIESVEGAGETPAYRGLSYVVIERLALADFGNAPPQLTVLVQELEGRTVADSLGILVARTGKLTAAANVDASAVSGEIGGYMIAGPKDVEGQLLPIVVAKDLLAKKQGAKMVFLPRSDSDALTIPEADLGSRGSSEPIAKPVEIERPSTMRLPTSVSVNYIDPNFEYQRGVQRENLVNQNNNVSVGVDVPLSMTGSQAREVGLRVLWVTHGTSRRAKTTLPPSYVHIEPTDVLTLPFNDSTIEVRASDVQEGANGVYEVSGLIIDGYLFDYSAGAEEPQGVLEETLQVPPDMTPLVMQIPALLEEHLEIGGLYLAAAATDVNADYIGAAWLESDDDTTYDEVDVQPVEASIVRALTALGDGSPNYIDTVNTVDVEVFEGELESVTEDEMLNGANRLLLGGEVIRFQNVTEIGQRQYRLDTLIRGDRGTDLFTGDHQTGELGVFLEAGAVRFRSLDLGLFSSTKYYKAVALNADADDEDAREITYVAATVKAFTPGHVVGEYAPATNDVTFTWVRRTRGFVRFMGDASTAPLYGEQVRFEIDILDSGTVVRTISITAGDSASYTAAQQIADGITPGDAIDFQIAQVHDELTGRGYVLAGTVAASASSAAFAHERDSHSPGFN